MTNPYKFDKFPPHHWVMVVCLDLVSRRGMSVGEAIGKTIALGINPELRYQWNEKRGEADILAIVQCDPISSQEEQSLSDYTIQQLWDIFGEESMWSASTGRSGNLSSRPIRERLEQSRPPAPIGVAASQ